MHVNATNSHSVSRKTPVFKVICLVARTFTLITFGWYCQWHGEGTDSIAFLKGGMLSCKIMLYLASFELIYVPKMCISRIVWNDPQKVWNIKGCKRTSNVSIAFIGHFFCRSRGAFLHYKSTEYIFRQVSLTALFVTRRYLWYDDIEVQFAFPYTDK